MHEMSLAMGIVDEIKRVMADYDERIKVQRITLEIGELRAVIPEALTFCFEVASQGTRAEGAELVVKQIPIEVACESCKSTWTADSVEFVCPVCNRGVTITRGKELVLRSIEIDDLDPAEQTAVPRDAGDHDAESGSQQKECP